MLCCAGCKVCLNRAYALDGPLGDVFNALNKGGFIDG